MFLPPSFCLPSVLVAALPRCVLCEYFFERSSEQRISAIVLSLIKHHPHLLQGVLTLFEEFNDGSQRDGRGELKWISECPGRDRGKGNAAQVVLHRNLQTPPIGAGQQLRLVLVTPSPHRTDGMD